jgi:hypothetical protein
MQYLSFRNTLFLHFYHMIWIFSVVIQVDAVLADDVAVGQDLVAGLSLEVGDPLEDEPRIRAVSDLQISTDLQTHFTPVPAQVDERRPKLVVPTLEIFVVDCPLSAHVLRQVGVQQV